MSWQLVNQNGNVWSGNVSDFTLEVANNFYSYGAPSRALQNQFGGNSSQATVIFQSDNFFEVMVDGDRALDFSILQPSTFNLLHLALFKILSEATTISPRVLIL